MSSKPLSSPELGKSPVPVPSLSREAKRSVTVVWFVIFLDLLGFGIVLPSLAYFVHILEVPEGIVRIGAKLGFDGVDAVFVGLLQATYSVFQFVLAPVWGRLSDRVGRKPVLIASLAGFACAWVVFAFSSSIWMLLFARSLAGAFAANISTAQAYVADLYPRERRAKGMGLIGMAIGIGFVFGPPLGALLSSDPVMGLMFRPGTEAFQRGHLLVPGLLAACLSMSALVLAATRLVESLPPEMRSSAKARRNAAAETRHAALRPVLGPLLFIYFVQTAGFANLEAMFSEFNLQHLHLGQSTNGLVFTAIGLTLAFVQGGLIGRLSQMYGSARVLTVGLAGLVASMICFGFQVELNPGLPGLAWLLLVSICVGGSYGLASPSLLAIISEQAKRSDQGETMGLTASAATLGRVVGPVMGGIVYSSSGPEWPFVTGGMLVLVALATFLGYRRRGST